MAKGSRSALRRLDDWILRQGRKTDDDHDDYLDEKAPAPAAVTPETPEYTVMSAGCSVGTHYLVQNLAAELDDGAHSVMCHFADEPYHVDDPGPACDHLEDFEEASDDSRLPVLVTQKRLRTAFGVNSFTPSELGATHATTTEVNPASVALPTPSKRATRENPSRKPTGGVFSHSVRSGRTTNGSIPVRRDAAALSGARIVAIKPPTTRRTMKRTSLVKEGSRCTKTCVISGKGPKWKVAELTATSIDGIAATANRSGRVKVKLVRSGRWAETQAETAEILYDDVAARTVTATEALDGAGTFVGGGICTSRVPEGGARVWDYGLVVGYKWDEDQRGLLDVNVNGTVVSIAHEPIAVLDVAVEVYALRPCGGKSVSLIMLQEPRQSNKNEIGEEGLHEMQLLPLLDITNFEVGKLPIRHILDFVYYKDGGYSPPAGVTFGDLIFDLVQPVTSRSEDESSDVGVEVLLSDGLSDSDDDTTTLMAQGRISNTPAAKHRRVTKTGHAEPVVADPGSVPRVQTGSDLRLQEYVDQLISLRRAGLVANPPSDPQIRHEQLFKKERTASTYLNPDVFGVDRSCGSPIQNMARQLYPPMVQEAFAAAVTFLGELQVSDVSTSESALTEITAWIDDRLELFLNSAPSVAAAFKISKVSANRDESSSNGKHQSARIPIAALKALPKQDGKQICLRFLSAQGCRGKNGKCIIKNLRNFIPVTLPDVVRDFIDEHYGDLSSDMQFKLDSKVKCFTTVARCPLRDYLATRQQQFDQTVLAHRRLVELALETASIDLVRSLKNYALEPPNPTPTDVVHDNKVVHLLDCHKQSVYNQLIRRAGLQLPVLVHLLRGETPLDTRPNKALELPTAHSSWADYKYQTRWKNIVEHGVRPTWCKDFPPQAEPPPNHGSAKRALTTMIKNLRAGVTCSPFGAVQKGKVDLAVDARIIHDLSYPPGSSVNDNTLPEDDINISYDRAEAISNRIIDVAELFPKLQFAGTIPGLGILVIDLCCPFGWKNSPSSYWIAGAAINHLYANSAPEWPGQPKTGKANLTPNRGPDACNDKKFSKWFVRGRSLGLDWDLGAHTVSIPRDKVDKARRRILATLNSVNTTRTMLLKFLGSLRHVLTCIRSAASFFQRVSTLAKRAPRFSAVGVSEQAKDDLRWFDLILTIGRLNAIPLQRFTRRDEPSFEIFMAASDRGLCALFPVQQEYLQVRFDTNELELIRGINDHIANEVCINVRELMSAVLASLVWGHRWADSSDKTDSHVKFWIDNSSAVSWNNRKASRNSYAQMPLRIFGICEVKHGFYTSAGHIPGVNNIMADAGSRVWQSPSLAKTFANMSFGWKQVQIPSNSRDLSRLWARYCERGLWPNRQGSTTHVRGDIRAARWVFKAAAVLGTRADDPALATRQGGITAGDVSSATKKAASRMGLDPARFSTHSVRIGGATALLNAGADRLVIKMMGRWLSNASEDYPVLPAKGSTGLAQQIC
ncbi:hypothetical protein ON010_g9370 [Phytophthora cinnamomi]|nr:hypothetical protein ON010_g9370 [Phytophthora cinnamomi]